MPALKIGVELAGLRLPFQRALGAAARLGADAVEIDGRGEVSPDISRTGVRQVRKLLEDHRLQIAALRFRTRQGYDTTSDLEARVAATKAAMELAYRLGATVVVNSLGRVPADRDSPAWQLLVDVLDDLGRHGDRVGALLAAETGSQSGPDLARLLDDLPAGTLGVELDPGSLVLGGFSPLEAVDALGPRILHVRATDALGDRAGRVPWAARPPLGRGHVALGEGTADFPALLAALGAHGYRGCFTVCPHAPDDPQRQMAQAVRYLRELSGGGKR